MAKKATEATAVAEPENGKMRVALKVAEPTLPDDVCSLTLPRDFEEGSFVHGQRYMMLKVGERKWELKAVIEPA